MYVLPNVIYGLGCNPMVFTTGKHSERSRPQKKVVFTKSSGGFEKKVSSLIINSI